MELDQVTDEAVQEPGEAAQEPAEGSEVTQELAREEPGADIVAKEEQDDVPKLVKVQSLAKSTLRQPSSGWPIEPGKDSVRCWSTVGWKTS